MKTGSRAWATYNNLAKRKGMLCKQSSASVDIDALAAPFITSHRQCSPKGVWEEEEMSPHRSLKSMAGQREWEGRTSFIFLLPDLRPPTINHRGQSMRRPPSPSGAAPLREGLFVNLIESLRLSYTIHEVHGPCLLTKAPSSSLWSGAYECGMCVTFF